MARTRNDGLGKTAAEEQQAAVLSPDERRAQGKVLREEVPREKHGGWKAPKGRRDPVELLVESNQGRLPELVPIRFGRMLQSPFAFYRGSAAIMAADLASTPVSGLRVQACGDAHLMNFGGFATPERQVIFDVNDLDETLPAPWEWDLKRLAASIVIAAHHLELGENQAARAATATARAYRERMADYSSMRALDVWYDAITVDRVLAGAPSAEVRKRIVRRVQKARQQSAADYIFPKLAEHRGALPRIKDDPPLIFHPTAEQTPAMRTNYGEALADYRSSLPEHVRTLLDRFQFCDLAVKVVGVGSVGTVCAVMLMMAADNDPLFLQVKEARASVLEPYAGESLHANHGQRVVTGQRLMQAATDIFLGWGHGEAGKHYYVRQLRDVKISALIEGWDVELLITYGQLCAWALARAHARSGDPALLAGYMGSSAAFDDAIGEFAVEYGDQNQRDYRAFVKAVREGRIEAIVETI
ncbi:DUF2252 domain-containing protein [Accumulibacter sp.]|uniref:DUF2252 domain-containing protein n=1 Tax=Accumulibacter sp. TaxID=2053492 RepID=UPI0025E299C1|nr:DUF2252 domain-containing protein [Accumulibacter sp.]MCM8595377.1 DUF2252 domain-containing protein [Accumulibacter sp.]MCM8626442.1 DUF2252 domain-containing protein [Accumulibacter sp.]MDS4049524.1 DUF2252 domain-containing protein [Accumulibacter sp.]